MTLVLSFQRIPLVTLGEAYWLERGAYLARLYEAHGPIFRAPLGGDEVVFLLGPAANRFVLMGARHAFSHRLGWGWVFGETDAPPHLLAMDSPEHDRHRRLLNPAFAARRMEGYLPLIARTIERRLAGWPARGVVDVYEETRIIAFDLAAEAFLGLRPGPDLALCRAVYLHGARQRAGALAELLGRTIAARRDGALDDALGLLAGARDAQGAMLSEAQLLAHIDILLIAGYETTASLGAWALYLLTAHREYGCRVLEELDRLPAGAPLGVQAIKGLGTLDRALREAERLYPPVPVAPRGVTEDLVFEGYRIPAGTKVYYSAAATHLLPSIWTAPALFDPDRFAPPREEHKRVAFSLIGFGGGPRICIGLSFARLELLVLLARALGRYQLELLPGQSIAQRYGVTSKPVRGLRMRVQKRGTDGCG